MWPANLSTTSTEEVKRLSGTVSSKDLELEGLRADLSNLTSQLEDLKVVITQSEGEADEKLDALQREHRKSALEMERRV